MVSAAAVTGYRMYRNSKVLTLVDANIEALSNDEDAVKTARCYITKDGGGRDTGWIFSCNDKTNETTIYSCPTDKIYYPYNPTHYDRCVDNSKN